MGTRGFTRGLKYILEDYKVEVVPEPEADEKEREEKTDEPGPEERARARRRLAPKGGDEPKFERTFSKEVIAKAVNHGLTYCEEQIGEYGLTLDVDQIMSDVKMNEATGKYIP